MRPGSLLSRRSLLGFGAAALGCAAAARMASAEPKGTDEPVSIEVRATPLDHFSAGDKERRVFGALTFRAGLDLRSAYEGFGGLSGLWRSADGRSIVALTDNAQWLTALVATANGRLSGLADVVMAPILGADGRPLRHTRAYDTEALAIANGVAYVGIERVHEVRRFDWARDGIRAKGQPVAVPPEAKRLPSNKSLEAIGVAPPKHPLAGAVIAIAEQARPGESTPTRGFILTGPRKGAFDVARSDEYDITDLAFLPSGEMLLLERRFSILRGPAARIRRIGADAIAPGATVDGPAIFEADAGYQIDNMEGIALHQDASGTTIVTLVSDDNFSPLQRTLMLEFALSDDRGVSGGAPTGGRAYETGGPRAARPD